MKGRHLQFGAVALEFIMLFPFVVAMLYGAAVYGLTFFAQYRMQNAVDTAVATALYVDRSAYEQSEALGSAVTQRANAALAGLVAQLPNNLRNLETDSACVLETVGGIEMLRCQLVYSNYASNPIAPALDFGMLGAFPPLPAQLDVDARAAF